MRPWTLFTAAVGLGLYLVAVNHDLYDLTSPPSFAWHILLRKTYSIVAFVLVGYLSRRVFAEWGRRLPPLGCILLVALYSGAIEIGQALTGSNEALGWSAFGIACGAASGLLASLIPAPEPAVKD